MDPLEINIPCQHCRATVQLTLADMKPGTTMPCPHCGTLMKFSGPDVSKIQTALDPFSGTASIKFTVKTKQRPPPEISLTPQSNLKQISRRIWMLSMGGAGLFIATVFLLTRLHPNAPANTLVNRHTIWFFLPSILLACAGAYVSIRQWVCPYCRMPLRTRYPIPRTCPRCKRDIGLYDN